MSDFFRIEEITVPDPAVWPTDYSKSVKRYALVTDKDTWWIGGRVFGVLRSLMYDRSSSDARHLLRMTPQEAWLDSIRFPVDSREDLTRQCMHFTWDIVPDLIFECGSDTPVIEAFFEMSGSSVIRDYHHDKWVNCAIEVFGEHLREAALRWLENTSPKYMPTSYLEKDITSQRRKTEWISNIKYTARLILDRFQAVQS